MGTPQVAMYEHNPSEQLFLELQNKNIGGNTDKPIYKMETNVYVEDYNAVIALLQKAGGKQKSQAQRVMSKMEDASFTGTWEAEEGLVFLCFYGSDKTLNLEATSFNEAWLINLFKELGGITSTRPPSSSIMVLVTSERGLRLNSIGEANSPLQKVNYSPEVLLQYNHLKECLGTKDPCGRLILLSGPPGTGKSYMIRAITSEVEALFILVPNSIAGDITGPNFLPLMLEHRDTQIPIVLLIEDADLYLAKKARDTNPTGISDLLNLGDGLFGEMADIRIVATSNADKLTIDDAILRPGRMCTHIEMNGLMSKEANACYKSLTGKDFVGKLSLKGTPLSDIYKMARNNGWKPTPSDETGTGQYL
jgi:tRNA A37 threonylcarbamoyladenosine biosynthesis protein TsaE